MPLTICYSGKHVCLGLVSQDSSPGQQSIFNCSRGINEIMTCWPFPTHSSEPNNFPSQGFSLKYLVLYIYFSAVCVWRLVEDTLGITLKRNKGLMKVLSVTSHHEWPTMCVYGDTGPCTCSPWWARGYITCGIRHRTISLWCLSVYQSSSIQYLTLCRMPSPLSPIFSVSVRYLSKFILRENIF